MPLSLKETQGLAALAKHLYDYLPASGAIFTFGSAAEEAGVPELWPGVARMSKLPALTHLLEATLEQRRAKFCQLVDRIVRGGLKYRTKKGTPLTRSDLEELNRLVAGVGFKIPELWASEFLDSLPVGKEPVVPAAETPAAHKANVNKGPALSRLLAEFMTLHGMTDRRQAGLGLEGLLNGLFEVFNLAPEKPFRVEGEQIDGSFVLDHEVYLLEAKWTTERIDQKELYAFRGKIEGKSSYTHGLFVSMAGFTGPAQAAITQGKTPNFVMMDGAHLFRVVQGQHDLDELLRKLARHLAERGEPYLPVQDFV